MHCLAMAQGAAGDLRVRAGDVRRDSRLRTAGASTDSLGLTESTLLGRTAPLKRDAPHAAVVSDCHRMSRCQTLKGMFNSSSVHATGDIITELAINIDRPPTVHHD